MSRHDENYSAHLPPIPKSLSADTRLSMELNALKVKAPPVRNSTCLKTTSQLHCKPIEVTVNGEIFEQRELLGTGGSSQVFKVKAMNGLVLALKKVSLKGLDPEVISGYKSEISLLQQFQDVNQVVQLYNAEITPTHILMVMERGEIDLRHIIDALKADALDADLIWFYASGLFTCVEAVHSYSVVHSDLKPANFVMVGGVLKIIDFGIASCVPEHTVNIHRQTQVGTISYMAPETLLEHTGTVGYTVGKPSDIWSCGCILYEMIYGQTPFKQYGRRQVEAIINPNSKIKFHLTASRGGHVPSSLIDLMAKCLDKHAPNRTTARGALNSAFLQRVTTDYAFLKDLIYKAMVHGASQKRELGPNSRKKLAENVWRMLGRMVHGSGECTADGTH